jgi:hypothetical protein
MVSWYPGSIVAPHKEFAFAEDVLYDYSWRAEDILGLDHMDEGNKRTTDA